MKHAFNAAATFTLFKMRKMWFAKVALSRDKGFAAFNAQAIAFESANDLAYVTQRCPLLRISNENLAVYDTISQACATLLGRVRRLRIPQGKSIGGIQAPREAFKVILLPFVLAQVSK
jgi:hypothetical protein